LNQLHIPGSLSHCVANDTASTLQGFTGAAVMSTSATIAGPQGDVMKRILIACSLLLFASGSMSYAANTESGSVRFPDPVRIGTNNLPAGTYSIHWEAGSGDVQVKISGNGHEISVPAIVSPSVDRDQVATRRAGGSEVVEGFTVKATNFTIKNP
jgi:hypothetical protein